MAPLTSNKSMEFAENQNNDFVPKPMNINKRDRMMSVASTRGTLTL